ncbi:MAG: YggS family pyridoxal phosphate-dependent enzyme [Bdellovibrionales bacterium]
MVGSSLAINVLHILREIETVARATGRDAKDVRLVAVSKTVEAGLVRQACALGLKIFGENYVQEWQSKARLLHDCGVEWHLIGALQSNKAKQVVGEVSMIHSLDRDSLAQAISKCAVEKGVRQKVLVEVNFAAEESKAGVHAEQAPEQIQAWAQLPNLNLCGLMVMPPASVNSEDSRPYFRQARVALQQWSRFAQGHDWNELSMGTSQDYKVAIAEGATLIRLGTVLFGERPKG